MKWKLLFLIAAVLLTTVVTDVRAADDDDTNYVSRQEYEKLKEEIKDLKTAVSSGKGSSESQAETEEYLEYITEELEAVKQLASQNTSGTSKFLVTGFATADFINAEGMNSTFGASFSPVFLWKLGDNILFESELEIELEDGATEVNLDYAHVSYLFNDWLTLGAGKFLTPFGIYNERLHPAWINKLPDAPLPYMHHGGLAPMSSLGFYARGGFPVGEAKGNYAVYVSNGPELMTDEEDEAGIIEFKNFEDINNNKAVGGRIGFLPIPKLEIGGSAQYSAVNPDGFESTNALLLGVDLSYVSEVESLGGTIDVRSEWIWSDVDDATYDPGGADFGPLLFENNKRNGGYVQIAYRPSKSDDGNDNDLISNIELVTRWDMTDVPDVGESVDQQRWTFGLNYWFNPSTVVKTAYRFDDRQGEDNVDAVLVQVAIGF